MQLCLHIGYFIKKLYAEIVYLLLLNTVFINKNCMFENQQFFYNNLVPFHFLLINN